MEVFLQGSIFGLQQDPYISGHPVKGVEGQIILDLNKGVIGPPEAGQDQGLQAQGLDVVGVLHEGPFDEVVRC